MPTVRPQKNVEAAATAAAATITLPSRYYDLISGSHSRHEDGLGVVTYRAGERILMNDAEAATHAARIVISRNQTPVEPAVAAAAKAAAVPVADPWLEVLENPSTIVISTVATMDDVTVLKRLLEAELTNRNRAGVVKTLQRRIDNLGVTPSLAGAIANNGPIES